MNWEQSWRIYILFLSIVLDVASVKSYFVTDGDPTTLHFILYGVQVYC